MTRGVAAREATFMVVTTARRKRNSRISKTPPPASATKPTTYAQSRVAVEAWAKSCSVCGQEYDSLGRRVHALRKHMGWTRQKIHALVRLGIEMQRGIESRGANMGYHSLRSYVRAYDKFEEEFLQTYFEGGISLDDLIDSAP